MAHHNIQMFPLNSSNSMCSDTVIDNTENIAVASGYIKFISLAEF